MRRRHGRRGLTLLEFLIAVGILAVLIGLILPAIHKAREAAIRLKSANKLRQINLAVHHFAAANDGTIPGYGIIVPGVPGYGSVPIISKGPFSEILPFLEEGNRPVKESYANDPLRSGSFVPAYQSPADPSLVQRMLPGDVSYIANHQVFRGTPRLGLSFPDGTANTITFAERYARCSETASLWVIGSLQCYDMNRNIAPCPKAGLIFERRPTFADPDFDDVLPVTIAGVTRPSVPGQTFQVAPTIDDCDYRIPQTPHRSGMLVAYMDGSVRTMRPGVAPELFWSAVTPGGGEVIPEW